MVAQSVLKYLNLIVDGRGSAGDIKEYTPPDLTVTTEEFRAGGMDAPIDIDMGMEKLTCSFVLASYNADVLALLGVKVNGVVNFTARGSFENLDGSTFPVVHKMRGKIISASRGTWGGGNRPVPDYHHVVAVLPRNTQRAPPARDRRRKHGAHHRWRGRSRRAPREHRTLGGSDD